MLHGAQKKKRRGAIEETEHREIKVNIRGRRALWRVVLTRCRMPEKKKKKRWAVPYIIAENMPVAPTVRRLSPIAGVGAAIDGCSRQPVDARCNFL
jgi:hypothetical protein